MHPTLQYEVHPKWRQTRISATQCIRLDHVDLLEKDRLVPVASRKLGIEVRQGHDLAETAPLLRWESLVISHLSHQEALHQVDAVAP